MPWPPILTESAARVRCACGRVTRAAMMQDVRPVQAQLGTDAEHLCDACMARHYRHGRITREAFARAHGARAEHVKRAASHDAALARLRGAP